MIVFNIHAYKIYAKETTISSVRFIQERKIKKKKIPNNINIKMSRRDPTE